MGGAEGALELGGEKGDRRRRRPAMRGEGRGPRGRRGLNRSLAASRLRCGGGWEVEWGEGGE